MTGPRNRPDDATVAAWRRLLEAHRRVTVLLDAELRAAHDLPLDWYDVLLQLDEAGEALPVGELARRVLISPPNATRLVERLVRAGLVERTVDADDGRIRRVALTPEGRRRFRRAAATHLAGIERHVGAHLDPSVGPAVTGFLAAVADAAAGLPDAQPAAVGTVCGPDSRRFGEKGDQVGWSA